MYALLLLSCLFLTAPLSECQLDPGGLTPNLPTKNLPAKIA